MFEVEPKGVETAVNPDHLNQIMVDNSSRRRNFEYFPARQALLNRIHSGLSVVVV